MLEDDEAPPGPLEAAAPPLPPVVLDEEPPLPELLVPPVAPASPADELEEPGELGAAVVDEDEDPPGMITVSFSFVTVDVGAAPPGMTVVSFFSQAERAKAPISTNT